MTASKPLISADLSDLSRCCERCARWTGNRDRKHNAKHMDETAECKQHSPAEFHWWETCTYFEEEAGGKEE